MHTIHLEQGVEQLKSLLEALSDKLDSPINSTRIEEIIGAIQQQDDGEEEDIDLNVSCAGEAAELMIKSSTVHFTGPKVSLKTASEALASELKVLVG